MSSEDKENYVLVSTDDADMFDGNNGADGATPVNNQTSDSLPSESDAPVEEAPPKSEKTPKAKKPRPEKKTSAPVQSEPEQIPSEFIAALKNSNEPIAGMVVWEDRVVVSILEYRAGKAVLRSTGELVLPEDSSDLEQSKLIKKWWRKNRFKTRSVWVAVATHDTVQKYFTHSVSSDDLEAAIAADAADTLQEDPSGALYDYYLFDKKADRDPHKGMLFACPEWVLSQYKKKLQDAGLLVCGFGVLAAELAKTFRWLGPPSMDKFADCVLYLTESAATVVILFGENSFYSRRVETLSAGWETHMDYLVQSLNDAFMYFQLYLSEVPVGRLYLTGVMPSGVDMTSFLLM
ncbi:MAG: hypothetical protein OEL75_03060, partial [Kiritimatiellaceae bacterium]|nr:hypothetical protein [Kiritimatiellaceae bacterium]